MSRHPSTLSEMAKRLSAETGIKHTECLRALERAAEQATHPEGRYVLALQDVTGELVSLRTLDFNALAPREQALLLGNPKQPFDVDRWWVMSTLPLGVWAADREVRLDFIVHVARFLASIDVPVTVPTRDPQLVDPELDAVSDVVDLRALPGGAAEFTTRLRQREEDQLSSLIVVEVGHGLIEEDYQQLLEYVSYPRFSRVLCGDAPARRGHIGEFRSASLALEAVLLDDEAAELVEEFFMGGFPREECPPRPDARGAGLYLDTTRYLAVPFGPTPERARREA